jgi:hypothetical protein
MRRALVLLAAAAVVVTACSGDDDATDAGATVPPAATTPVDPPTGVAAEDAAFCGALERMGTATDPTTVFATYDQLEASAPEAIADDVDAFVANAREISEAVEPLVGSDDPAAVAAALEGISPEAREMYQVLADSAGTGSFTDESSPAAVVIRYGMEHCGLG